MSYLKTFTNLIKKKKNLLKCIFTTLLCQILITTLVFIIVYKNNYLKTNKNNKNNKQPKTMSFIALFFFLISAIVLIIMMTTLQISFNQRVVLFTLFSIMQGLFLGSCLSFVDANVILASLFSTIALFFFMICIGLSVVYFQYDLSWLGIFLFLSLLGLIISRIVQLFIPYSSETNKTITMAALLLFSIYIIYDTNVILYRYNSIKYERDCILGTLDYYLDILNIFVNMNHSN